MDFSCLTADPVRLTCIPTLVQNLVYWAIRFAGVVALFLIIYSGFKFLTSGGDPKSVEEARKTMTYAFAGLLLVFLSFFIISIIAYITGVSCINLFGFRNCR